MFAFGPLVLVSELGEANRGREPDFRKEASMKKIAAAAALVAMGLALAMVGPRDARADQSDDPDFCYGGWVWVPSMAMGPSWTPQQGYVIKQIWSGHWSCPSG